MIQQQNVPSLGDSVAEAEIVEWLVAIGEAVGVDQDIVEMATDKSTVSIPSQWRGIMHATHGTPGQVLQVGQPLFSVDET